MPLILRIERDSGLKDFERGADGTLLDATLASGKFAGQKLSELNAHYLAFLYDRYDLMADIPEEYRTLVKTHGLLAITPKRLVEGEKQSPTLARWVAERRKQMAFAWGVNRIQAPEAIEENLPEEPWEEL